MSNNINFSDKGKELINLYTEMAENGYDRVDKSHVTSAFNDFELRKFRKPLKKILEKYYISTVLDYGCGGSNWECEKFDDETGLSAKKYFNLQKIYRYEPARSIDERSKVDCVISFDVLEHIFISDIPAVLRNIFSYSEKIVVLRIACYPAIATLPNGENAHITVRDYNWWKGMIDGISLEFPNILISLICTQNGKNNMYPIWNANMWQECNNFVIDAFQNFDEIKILENDLFNKNLLTLNKFCSPGLLDNLKKIKIDKSKFQIKKDNDHFIITINENNIHSKKRPYEQAERQVNKWITEHNLSKPARVSIFGLAPFFHIETIIKSLPNSSIIRIIDEDLSFFKKLLTIVDFSFLLKYETSKSIKFIIGENWDYLKDKIIDDSSYAENSDVNRQHLLFRHPISFKYCPELIKYIELHKDINEQFENYGFSDHERRLINTFKNLNKLSIVPPINYLKNKFINKECVFIASGPSLNRTIEWVKKNKEQLLILCANSTLPILLKYEIMPHFVIQIDSTEKLLSHIQDLPKIKSYFISLPVMHSDFFDFYENRAFFYSTHYPQFLEDIRTCFNLENDTLYHNSTVANTGIAFAEYLGCERVYTLGIDMGYSGNQIYAKNAKYEENTKTLENRENIIAVYANNGEKIKTSLDFESCIKSLEKYFLHHKNSIEVINCSDTGVKLNGISSIPEKDLFKIKVNNDIDYFNIIKECLLTGQCYLKKEVQKEKLISYVVKNLNIEESLKKSRENILFTNKEQENTFLVSFMNSNVFCKMLLSCINIEKEMQSEDFSPQKIFDKLIKKADNFKIIIKENNNGQ